MMKSIIATLVALFSAVIVIFFVEMISHHMYPPPLGIDLKNKQVMEDWLKTLPVGAMLMVLLGWFLGAIVGGYIASYMDKENPIRRSTVVGAILLGATLMNFFEVPSPVWMWGGGVVSIVLGVWIGFLVCKRQEAISNWQGAVRQAHCNTIGKGQEARSKRQ